MAQQTTIIFEAQDPDRKWVDIHNLLSEAIHEGNLEALEQLRDHVTDIRQPTSEVKDQAYHQAFVAALKADLQIEGKEGEQEFDSAVEYAGYDARFAELDHLNGLEESLRKLDLGQIGYILLSDIGEANHGSWDGFEREDLVKINYAFGVLKQTFDYAEQDQHQRHFSELEDWGFGGMEHWDSNGVRHERK